MARVEAALRRLDFVEATVRTIAKFGVAGATTRRIAEEADSPLASLHYVFSSKDELFHAVLESLGSDITPNPEEFVNTPVHVAAPLLVRRIMHWLRANPEYATSQAELFYWALRRNKQLARDYDYYTFDGLKKILSTTQHQLNESQIEQISRLCLMLIEGQLSSWFAQDDFKIFSENLDNSCKVVSLFISNIDVE